MLIVGSFEKTGEWTHICSHFDPQCIHLFLLMMMTSMMLMMVIVYHQFGNRDLSFDFGQKWKTEKPKLIIVCDIHFKWMNVWVIVWYFRNGSVRPRKKICFRIGGYSYWNIYHDDPFVRLFVLLLVSCDHNWAFWTISSHFLVEFLTGRAQFEYKSHLVYIPGDFFSLIRCR